MSCRRNTSSSFIYIDWRCNAADDDLMRRIWAVMVVLGACERAPIFVDPGERGGFLVACWGVTNFGPITPCDPVEAARMHNNDGGCTCAQGNNPSTSTYTPTFGLPPTVNHEAQGVISLDNPLCTTTYVGACVPKVFRTTVSYPGDSAGSGDPKGTARLDRILKNDLLGVMKPVAADVLAIHPSLDPEVAAEVAADAQAEMLRACRLSHFSSLTSMLIGTDPFKDAAAHWSAENQIALKYIPVTTIMDGLDLKEQGWLRSDPGSEVWDAYTSHIYGIHDLGNGPVGQLKSCNEGGVWPFGLASATSVGYGGYIGNKQDPGTTPMPRRESVVLDPGSSGILQVSGVAEAKSIELEGSADFLFSNCDSEQNCDASIGAFQINTSPFKFHGYDVSSMRVIAGASVEGALAGNLLTIPVFSGTVHVTLTDGRVASVPVRSGVVLARWDANARSFVMAFAFSSVLEDSTTIDLNGTAFGAFTNIGPNAVVSVASATNSVTPSAASIECTGPAGTTVNLNSGASTDAEEGSLTKAVWHSAALPAPSVGTELAIANLPLGETSVKLIVSDKGGFSDDQPFVVTIEDTAPPVISATDICVFPPNDKEVSIELAGLLNASAIDVCTGDSTGTLRILGVSSSSGDGVVSWNTSSACLTVKRSGTEPNGRTYSLLVEAQDANQNSATATVRIVVPHDATQARGCHRTAEFSPCH